MFKISRFSSRCLRWSRYSTYEDVHDIQDVTDFQNVNMFLFYMSRYLTVQNVQVVKMLR